MRVVTFDIHRWRTLRDEANFALVADLLKAVAADVIGLNEVLRPAPTAAGAALPRLADELGMYVAFRARAGGQTRPGGGGSGSRSWTAPRPSRRRCRTGACRSAPAGSRAAAACGPGC